MSETSCSQWRRIRRLCALLLMSLMSAIASVHAAEPATAGLIIQYRDKGSDSAPPAIRARHKQRTTLRAQENLTLIRSLGAGRELVSAPDNVDLHHLASQIATRDDVSFASPNYRRQVLLTPNDPLFAGGPQISDQAYLYDGQYSVQAPAAWDITTGSSATVIAIIDTGALGTHAELADRAVPGTGHDFVSADSPGVYTSANDGDSRDGDPSDPGDFCDGRDSSWHGTGVASIAAGNSDDAVGMTGIDWSARLLHVRAFGACGGTDADIIDAVRWSAGLTVNGVAVNPEPASIINLSIGGVTECTLAWQNVIDEVNELGVTLVLAAGNEANNALRSSPANCADVITVASNTLAGAIDSGFSNFGLKVSITTPGRNIVLATNNGRTTPEPDGNGYSAKTGSSFSAAIVSGALGLIDSLSAQQSTATRRSILQQSATPFASNGDCGGYCGAGILNLAAAIELTSRYDGTISNAATEQLAGNWTELPIDSSQNDSLQGYRAMNYHRIDASSAGVLIVTSEAAQDLYAYLLSDRLSVVALDDNSGNGLNFRVAAAVDPGTYWLAVERAHHRISDGASNYSVSASLSDATPTPFTFADVFDVAPGVPIQSGAVTISGLTDPVPVSTSNGGLSINGSDFRSIAASIDNGDTLRVAILSAGAQQTRTSADVRVGNYTTQFSVTTGSTPARGGSAGCTLHPQRGGAFDPLLPLLLAAAVLAGLRRRGNPAPDPGV